MTKLNYKPLIITGKCHDSAWLVEKVSIPDHQTQCIEINERIVR